MALDKVVDSTQLDADLTSVANAIRDKSGGSAQLAFPSGFVSEINNISSGISLEQVGDGNFAGVVNYTGTSLRAGAFSRSKITEFYGPNVTTLYSYANTNCAFADCSELRVLSLPKITTTYAKDYLAHNCSKLESVRFDALTAVGTNHLTYSLVTVLVLPKVNGILYATALAHNTKLEAIDLYKPNFARTNALNGCTKLTTIIIRNTSVSSLSNINNLGSTPFASGGTGGTLYVPQSLIASYQSATNWSTILGYANNSIAAIEGSIYETAYADGTPISTT